jgi:hypothetical protein
MSRRNRNKKRKEKIRKKVQQYSSPETDLEFKETKTEEGQEEIKLEGTSTIDEATRKIISKDIKVILITLLILGLILAGVKILQAQTDLIDNFGDWLVQILNIHTT